MTAAERRLAGAILHAMIPATPSLPGLAAIALDEFWPTFVRAATPLLRLGLRAAILAVGLVAPLMLLGRWRFFPSLTADDQDRVLTRAAQSRWYVVRQLIVTLKAVACFAYLRDPSVRAAVERLGGAS